MKVRDIYKDRLTKVFIVTEQIDDNELNWTIKPTGFDFVPDNEGQYYFVKAYEVSQNGKTDCYISIMTPERIAEIVIKQNSNGQTEIESIYDQEQSIIPAIASECFGVYELFYAKENPQIGIDILKNGLIKAINKNVVAEDLGYILRDEGRIEEAIAAFQISEEHGPSSEYIFWELAELYKQLGDLDKQKEYRKKYEDNGGIDNGDY